MAGSIFVITILVSPEPAGLEWCLRPHDGLVLVLAPLFLNVVFWETYHGFRLPWGWLFLAIVVAVGLYCRIPASMGALHLIAAFLAGAWVGKAVVGIRFFAGLYSYVSGLPEDWNQATLILVVGFVVATGWLASQDNHERMAAFSGKLAAAVAVGTLLRVGDGFLAILHWPSAVSAVRPLPDASQVFDFVMSIGPLVLIGTRAVSGQRRATALAAVLAAVAVELIRAAWAETIHKGPHMTGGPSSIVRALFGDVSMGGRIAFGLLCAMTAFGLVRHVVRFLRSQGIASVAAGVAGACFWFIQADWLNACLLTAMILVAVDRWMRKQTEAWEQWWSWNSTCVVAGLALAYAYGFLIAYETAKPNVAVCVGVALAIRLARPCSRLIWDCGASNGWRTGS